MMARFRTLFVLVPLLGACVATWAPPFDQGGPRVTALVLLDLQRDFLQPDGRMPIEAGQVEPLVARAGELVAEARSRGVLVVRVHNAFSPLDVGGNVGRNHAALRGSEGAQADPRIPAGEDAYFEKEFPDAFTRRELDEFLRAHGVTHVVITGVFADQCVYWTSRAALNRELVVTVVEDGVGAASGGKRERALRALVDRGVVVASSMAEVQW